MKLIAGWNGGKTGPTCPDVEEPCCGRVFYTPMGLGTETDVIVVSEVSQARADWKADKIAMRVNNHERLVDMLRELVETEDDGLFEMLGDDYCERLNALLAQLEAGKRGRA